MGALIRLYFNGKKWIKNAPQWLRANYHFVVAAIMFFVFPKTNCIHAQYIATNPDFKILQPGTAIYIHTIREAAKEGFQNISFGISTENHGEYLNQNLLHFKESFGAKHSINAFYTKNF